MGKRITEKTGDFPHPGTNNQFIALEIKNSRVSFLKMLLIPFAGVYLFIRRLIMESKKNVTSYLSFLSPGNSHQVEFPKRKIYLTDKERNLTFAGAVISFEELKGKISVSLLDVYVYEYCSSNPLYYLPLINISRPKDKLHKEEL